MIVTLNTDVPADLVELHLLAKRYPIPAPRRVDPVEVTREFFRANGGQARWAPWRRALIAAGYKTLRSVKERGIRDGLVRKVSGVRGLYELVE